MKILIEESVLRQALNDITECHYWRAMSTLRTALEGAGNGTFDKPFVFQTVPTQPEIKPHQIAQLVNELRDIAVKYHDHQSLRSRLAEPVHDLWKVKEQLRPEYSGKYGNFHNEVKMGNLTIQEFGKEIRKSRESAIAFLQRAGILDENGDLAEPYRSEG